MNIKHCRDFGLLAMALWNHGKRSSEWIAALLSSVPISASVIHPAALKRLSMGKSLPSAGV
jgi:hypothetical protein